MSDQTKLDILYILAHTQIQFDLFVRTHLLAKSFDLRRVMRAEDIFGVSSDTPLVLLPGYYEAKCCDEVLAIWHNRRGAVVRVSEGRALGQRPLCINDTDGDSNCHLCAGKGGCLWPRCQ